jgi:hypothetical protein
VVDLVGHTNCSSVSTLRLHARSFCFQASLFVFVGLP